MSGNNSSEMVSDIDCNLCCNEKIKKKLHATSGLKISLFFAAILAGVSLSTALWLRYARLASRELVLGIDDQRTLRAGDGDFSRMFCSKYDLEVTGSSSFAHSNLHEQNFNYGLINAYMLLKSPSRSFKKYIRSREYDLELTSSSDYKYWAYHLDEADLYLNLFSLSCSNLTMFLIQEKKFFQWMHDSQRGHFCSSCIYKTYQFPCSTNITNTSLWLRNNEYMYSEYILLFQDPTLLPHSSLTAKISFTLFRENLIFKKDDEVSKCENVTDCQLFVSRAADTMLFQMEADSPSSSVTLATRCIPRVEMYFAFFLGVPLALWLVIVGPIWTLRKCQEDVLRETQNADNARSMARLHNGPPPAYSRPTTSAPSQTRSAFSVFSRSTPRPEQLPLIDYEVTSEENEEVSRSPPAYSAIHTVSIPRADPRREAMLEIYAATPPPDYTSAFSDRSRDASNT